MDEIKKVVLVQPNLKWCEWSFKTVWDIVPYNLCLLAAMIENEYEVEIIDANIDDWSEDEFARKISDKNPDVVGITIMTSEYAEAAHITAKLVKNVNRNIITVLGGVYATTSHNIAIEDDNIDYIVVGEGEYVFSGLLKYLDGVLPIPEEALAYKRDGRVVISPRADFIKDLDALPFPAYHKINYSRYINSIPRTSVDGPRRFPHARIRTSRGCPVGCVFCQVDLIAGKPCRTRSIENVIEELQWQKKTYGIKSVLFNDDNLVLNKRRAKALFKAIIDNKLNLTWNGTAIAVFSLDEEMLELMKQSGCQYIDIAIESGVQRVLKEIINKPVDLDHAKKMIKKIRELEIDVAANFVIGFPGETWNEIRQTIKFAEEINVDYVKIFIATPLRHTKLYDMVLKHNMVAKNADIDTDLNWSSSKITSDEFTPKDLSILRAYEWDRINFTDSAKRAKIAKMMKISEEDLKALRKKTLASVVIEENIER